MRVQPLVLLGTTTIDLWKPKVVQTRYKTTQFLRGQSRETNSKENTKLKKRKRSYSPSDLTATL